MNKTWDVIIIGGGLSGTAAGAKLASHGRKVLILEKETHPHHKVCGEFINSDALFYLAQFGIHPKDYGAQPISHVRITTGHQISEAPLLSRAMGLSRYLLDELLLSKAQETGAEIQRSVCVTTINLENKIWSVCCKNGETFYAAAIFLATGKHEVRHWQRCSAQENNFIGLKMHLSQHQDQLKNFSYCVDIVLFKGGYAGLECIEDGIINLCLVISKSRYRQLNYNWDNLIYYLRNFSPLLNERLHNTTTQWKKPLAIYGIPYGFIHHPTVADSNTFYRLGDQMAVIPSLSGTGMALALHSGLMAADSYLKNDANVYHRRAYNELHGLIRRAVYLTKFIAYPVSQRMVLTLCQFRPKVLQLATRQTKLKTVYY